MTTISNKQFNEQPPINPVAPFLDNSQADQLKYFRELFLKTRNGYLRNALSNGRAHIRLCMPVPCNNGDAYDKSLIKIGRIMSNVLFFTPNLTREMFFVRFNSGEEVRRYLISQDPDITALRNRIEVMNLQYSDLSVLPSEIEHLQGLKILFLNDNSLRELPEQIGNLSHLEILNLSNNDLESLPPSLSHLPKLRILNIRNNSISRLPDQLDQLSLQELGLEGNCFSLIHPNFIRDPLPYLSTILFMQRWSDLSQEEILSYFQQVVEDPSNATAKQELERAIYEFKSFADEYEFPYLYAQLNAFLRRFNNL
jgi:hypothetical protein